MSALSVERFELNDSACGLHVIMHHGSAERSEGHTTRQSSVKQRRKTDGDHIVYARGSCIGPSWNSGIVFVSHRSDDLLDVEHLPIVGNSNRQAKAAMANNGAATTIEKNT